MLIISKIQSVATHHTRHFDSKLLTDDFDSKSSVQACKDPARRETETRITLPLPGRVHSSWTPLRPQVIVVFIHQSKVVDMHTYLGSKGYCRKSVTTLVNDALEVNQVVDKRTHVGS